MRLREDTNKEANNLTEEQDEEDQVEGEDGNGNGDKNRNECKSERRAPFLITVSALLLLNYLSSLSLSDLPLLQPGPTKLSCSGFAFGIPVLRVAKRRCCDFG